MACIPPVEKLTFEQILDVVNNGNDFLRESANEDRKARESVKSALSMFFLYARWSIPGIRYKVRSLYENEVPPGHTWHLSRGHMSITPTDNSRMRFEIILSKRDAKKYGYNQ